jgi:NAD(P)-dependent dehydrogenase (short-subunit alcohol dehydrogenase family)
LVDEPDIHVVTILPEAADTPIFEHAGNYTGRQVRPIPPVLDPEEVARGIEACAEDPKREITYGRAGRILEVLFAVAPPLYRRLAHGAFVRGTRGEAAAAPAAGNVLASTGPHAVEGGWRTRRRKVLRRAFLEALGGMLAGLLKRRA